MMTEEGLRKVGLAADAAATDPARFADMLVLLSDTCGAHGAVLFTPAVDPEGKNLSAAAGVCGEAMVEYARGWAAHDVWVREIQAIHRHRVPGDVLVTQECLTSGALHRTPFHADFLRRYDIESAVSLLVCDGAGRLAPDTRVSLYRPPGAPPFDKAEMEAMRVLWPRLQRSVETYWLLRKAREFDQVAEAALDLLPHPVWVVSRDARIYHANIAAQQVTEVHDGWAKCIGHRLVALGQFSEAELGSHVEKARIAPVPLVCTLVRGRRIERATLRVTPLAVDSPFVRAWPSASALLILELRADELTDAAWRARLAHHYGLTTAEQRVLRKLADGQSPKQIADEIGVSVATVRTHIRALLVKTSCRRQIDLMRLLLGR